MKDLTLYTEALELKQLGFDEPCFGVYFNPTQELFIGKKVNRYTEDVRTSAPTFSQAFRWFREKHQLVHHISWVYKKTYDGVDWFFQIKGINMANNNVLPHEETRFGTYEEAELACLKKLIELVKSTQG